MQNKKDAGSVSNAGDWPGLFASPVFALHHLFWRWGEMISPFCTNAQKNGKIGLKSCHFHTLQLYLDKVKGILSENDFLNLSKDFTNDRERLEKLVIETQKQLDVIERKIQTGDNRRQLIEQYTNLEHLDRETVETLIDYILVGKRIPGTRNVPIEIHWNF